MIAFAAFEIDGMAEEQRNRDNDGAKRFAISSATARASFVFAVPNLFIDSIGLSTTYLSLSLDKLRDQND